MDLQTEFDITVSMLHKNKNAAHSAELLALTHEHLRFSCFHEPSDSTTRERILSLYEFRYQLAFNRFPERDYSDWLSVLENLRCSEQTYVCIACISFDNRSFLIFSDYAREELIGIMDLNSGLAQGAQELTESIDNPEHSYKSPNVFLNGQLQNS